LGALGLAAALALGGSLTLAGCSPTNAELKGDPTDPTVLARTLGQLGTQAGACADPAAAAAQGLDPGGLSLFVEHAPVWVAALGADTTATADAAASVATCDREDMARTLLLAQMLATAAIAADPPHAATPLALVRALRLDWELTVNPEQAGAAGVDALSLQLTDAEHLQDLAAAEDQLGFAAEAWTARATAVELRERLAASAAEHRRRAEVFATAALAAGGQDPRRGTYAIDLTVDNDDAITLAAATSELALASHYAALPYVGPGAAEDALRHQLLAARSWGAGLDALPFITG
jgi:hypothetical protein